MSIRIENSVRKEEMSIDFHNAIAVKKITSFEELESIRSDWKKLQLLLNPHSVHADIDWHSAIVREHSPNVAPLVFAFSEGGDLVGLIAGHCGDRKVPLKIGYLRLGQFSAPAFSIHYECSMAKNDGRLLRVMADTIWNELNSGSFRLIYINALPIDSPLYGLLKRNSLSKGVSLVYPPARHMKMRLSRTIEETMAHMGSSVRAHLHRTLKKSRRSNGDPLFSMRLFSRPDELDVYFADAERVAQKTYQRALHVGFDLSLLHRKHAEMAAHRGWFRGNVLYDGEVPIAFQEDYLKGTNCFNPYVGYDPAYRNANPGTVLLVKSWENLIATTKAEVYDFGYGEGEYKRRFADLCICEGELLLFANTVPNLIFFILLSIDLHVEKTIKMGLRSLGLYDRVKKFWRMKKAGN